MDILMDHIVLNVTNVEREVEFYISVLGFSPERLELYREGKVPFPSVRINRDTIIDFFPREMWGEALPGQKAGNNLNHFCLTVSKADFSRFLERLGEIGLTIEQGPVERWGARGTGISIYFRDPELNLIEVRYYENGADASTCLLAS